MFLMGTSEAFRRQVLPQSLELLAIDLASRVALLDDAIWQVR